MSGNRHFVYGNGESRKGFKVSNYGGISWGCNAIYRDTPVDNLVVMDFGMQGEVYDSDYVKEHKCWFSDWNPIPSDPIMIESFTRDFEDSEVHTYGFNYGSCVINGSHPVVVESKVNEVKKQFPHLNEYDLRIKMKKDLGLHIIYNNDEEDIINNIEDPVNWSAGSTAVHLACQHGADEVYMFGFDLSSYNDSINNIYKGSNNYLPETAKGFNPVNWRSQLNLTFNEFSDTMFKWIGNDFKYVKDTEIVNLKNVQLLTYEDIGDIR